MNKRAIYMTVVVSALGYFVDIYDLLLFGIVRIPSLRALGVADDQMLQTGIHLLNMQMAGMLIGGILWGVLGDLRGRKSVLFGSILLYSLCNIANAFVPNPEVYAVLRFLAGVGLAGELGAAVTLVSEVMSKESRGYGTAVIAGVGILGAVVASLIGDAFDWKTAYIVGGGMGLALLVLRAGLMESGLFNTMKEQATARGQFHQLFLNADRFKRYLCCIMIGVPIWCIVGIYITFAPELAKELGVQGVITGSKSIMWCYAGSAFGDFIAGCISQWIKSRKRTIFGFLIFMLVTILIYVLQSGWSVEAFYALCVAMGIAAGYWSVFAMIAAEQFGTNIRATVAITVPNIVRGAVVPMTISFQILKPRLGAISSLLTVSLILMAIAFMALYFLRETFGEDLDYYEALESPERVIT